MRAVTGSNINLLLNSFFFYNYYLVCIFPVGVASGTTEAVHR